MRRILLAGSVGLVAGWAGPAPAQQGGPPPVEAPAPAELPPVLEATPSSDDTPVLAVPGLPAPGSGPARSAPGLPLPSAPAPPATGGMPALDGPAEGLGAGPRFDAGSSLPAWPEGPIAPGRSPRASTLESTPAGPGDLLSGAGPRPRVPITPQPPARRPRLFGLGRFQPPPFFRGREANGRDDSIAVEPRSDPAADAALKRRIEEQIASAVGSRVRSVEVRVVDRDIAIRARVNRFWYRRAVKRSLETLPALAGYRPSIEVVD